MIISQKIGWNNVIVVIILNKKTCVLVVVFYVIDSVDYFDDINITLII